jgi:hypothetical protein
MSTREKIECTGTDGSEWLDIEEGFLGNCLHIDATKN